MTSAPQGAGVGAPQGAGVGAPQGAGVSATRPAGLIRPVDAVLADFASLVGDDGPVCVVGGMTQWQVGGAADPASRQVVAPTGVVSHLPEEMIARVRAGTTLAELDAVLAAGGQMIPFDLPAPARATVGGALAVGYSGPRRLRYGPLRDIVLEVRFVSAAGRLVTAGGPVVKNVTGYDLCRLLVGSLGTLGLLAEVVLRCYPRPAASRWFRTAASDDTATDPFCLLRRLYRPSSILWDGDGVWVRLEGHPDDVEAQATEVLGPAFVEVGDGPDSAGAERLSLPPGRLAGLPKPPSGPRWLAEIGVGAVHTDHPADLAAAVGLAWPPTLEPRVAQLHRDLKQRFDPAGRLNPGRRVL
jgi:FAD/FMN-containing dehydrogenase